MGWSVAVSLQGGASVVSFFSFDGPYMSFVYRFRVPAVVCASEWEPHRAIFFFIFFGQLLPGAPKNRLCRKCSYLFFTTRGAV